MRGRFAGDLRKLPVFTSALIKMGADQTGFAVSQVRTHASQRKARTLVKVNGNYPQDLARNLQLDTGEPALLPQPGARASECVYKPACDVCYKYERPLKCNSAFQNLLHKAHWKSVACLFKPNGRLGVRRSAGLFKIQRLSAPCLPPLAPAGV